MGTPEPGEVVEVYAGEPPPGEWHAAVFLAGPSPRDPEVASWRPGMTELLRERWAGPGRLVVFVPEPRRRVWPVDYEDQVGWEERCLHLADVVLFWVPREPAVLPGFTTNVEWGMWHDSGRVVFGAPPDAPGNRYLLRYAREGGVPVATTPGGTVEAALAELAEGEPRRGGERSVPLLIWRLRGFRRWYAAQRAAGNTLLGARVVWVHPPRSPFYWALHVQVAIAAEGGRVKSNEVVIFRPDLSTVVLYRPGRSLDTTEVVLVREFRSPASTPDGFVHELPGGAGHGTALERAVCEVREETGLVLDPSRLRAHGSRQLAATMSAHHAHLFSARVTGEELARLRSAAASGTAFGVRDDTERTVPEVVSYGRIRDERLVDWSTLGMLAQVLGETAERP